METYGSGDEWAVLGDPTRRAIVVRLADRPRAVGELADALPVSRPAVSQHLKVLKDAGLVDRASLRHPPYLPTQRRRRRALRDQLDTFWNRRSPATQDASTSQPRRTHDRDRRPVVRRQIVVEAPIEQAFAVFTDRFGDFKPPEHNLLCAPIAETVFEPRVGGHIYDRGIDGTECRWARVLAYEPPDRVVFSWDISPQWPIETDSANASEVEVRFVAESPERTRVELEHRNLDRHGPGWEAA